MRKTRTGLRETLRSHSITELGFVRVSLQAGLVADLDEAQQSLAGLKQSSTVPFVLVADTLGVGVMPKNVRKYSQLTDGHLMELANSVGAQLITLDTGIVGALLVS